MKKLFSALIICIIFTTLHINSEAASVVINDNEMTLSSEYSQDEIPQGYVETVIEYEGETVNAIYNESNNMHMIYLTCDSKKELNGFYLYNQQEGFNIIITLDIPQKALSISTPSSSISVPAGYHRTVEIINDVPVCAYKSENDDGSGNILIYGTINGTEYSWFLYNQDDNTCNRVVMDDSLQAKVSELENERDSYQKRYKELKSKFNKNINKARYLYLVEFVLMIAFFFLMINAMLKRKHSKIDYEDRILDLKINRGIETLPASNSELRKRNKDQDKASERRYKYFGNDDYNKMNYYPESVDKKRERLNQESPITKHKPNSNSNPVKSRYTPATDQAAQRLQRKLDEQGNGAKKPSRPPMQKPYAKYSPENIINHSPKNDLVNKLEPKNNINIENVEKSLEKISDDAKSEIKQQRKALDKVGGVTGSMDFSDDKDIFTIDLDD